MAFVRVVVWEGRSARGAPIPMESCFFAIAISVTAIAIVIDSNLRNSVGRLLFCYAIFSLTQLGKYTYNSIQ